MINKQQTYNKYRELERKNVGVKNIAGAEKMLKVKAIKEGDVWVVKHEGTEYRNKSKKEALRDLATTKKIDIKFGKEINDTKKVT